MRKQIAAVVMAFFLPSSATLAATICVNPASTLCQATIQAGVNAAAPGDIVKIAAGTYFEEVIVPSSKDGLQIVGAGSLTTILDPSPYADIGFAGGVGIRVLPRRVTIKNLMIRNGEGFGIYVSGPDVVIQRVNVNGANFMGIYLIDGAWNAKIIQNEIHNTLDGIISEAFGTVVQANFITGTQAAIALLGDGGQAIGNKIYNGAFGISASGDGAVVRNNDVRHQSEQAISVDGSFPTVQGNKVYGAGIGIQVNCTNCFGGSVSSNSVTDATSYGILASADDFGLVLQSNTLLRTGHGVSLNGIGITARLNKAADVGLDLFGHCFEVFVEDFENDWNMIAQNTATGCSQAGIYVFGARTLVERNVVSGTAENGITVGDGSSNVILSGNKTTGNAAQGIAVLGGSVDTVLSGNTATGNRRDFCDDGTGTSASGNTFGTSFDTPGVDCTIGH